MAEKDLITALARLEAPAAMTLFRSDLDRLISWTAQISKFALINRELGEEDALLNYPPQPSLSSLGKTTIDLLSESGIVDSLVNLRGLISPITLYGPSRPLQNPGFHGRLAEVATQCTKDLERCAGVLDKMAIRHNRSPVAANSETTSRDEMIAKIPKKSIRLAVMAADYAMSSSEIELSTDDQIWDWLDLHPMNGYALPKKVTFTTYLRKGRKYLGESKNSPVHARSGRSIARESDL